MLFRSIISPIQGDNTAHIQAAIDQAASLPMDSLGIRGAVLLSPGRYEIHGILNLKYDGVILRGVGDGEDRSEERRVGKECRSRWSPYH